MSHLSQEVCGVDFFLSYSKCNPKVFKLVENIKDFFNKNQITYYSSDQIEFAQNYLLNFSLQTFRSKIFLFFIDNYSLESELFLYNFVYAQSHSSKYHLPILLPIVFDNDFDYDLNEKQYENQKDKDKYRLDLKYKKGQLELLLSDCLISIKMSEMKSNDLVIRNLKELLIDIIPMSDDFPDDDEFNSKKITIEKRFIDNFRPISGDEENFLRMMSGLEHDIMKKFEISNFNLKTKLPKEKVYVALSVPYDELSKHLNAMINLSCHLIWIDCMVVNKINYFSLLWTSNDETMSSSSNTTNLKTRQAKPPSYIVFYDLNTAQIAHMHRELSLKNWNLELIEPYVKISRPKNLYKESHNRKSAKSARKPIQAKVSSNQSLSITSYEEIFYICQFKFLHDIKGDVKVLNKLHHSVTDLKFNDCFKETVYHDKSKQNYIPIKTNQILLNVNTLNNKHFYFTALYKPIPYLKSCQEEQHEYENLDKNLKTTGLFSAKNNLSDTEFYDLWFDFTSKNWKLIDLKAYKDEKNITKFSAIWTQLTDFYEGSSKLFMGLNKNELLTKVNEMNIKGLYPKFISNYGYLNSIGEHVYCIFFCQF